MNPLPHLQHLPDTSALAERWHAHQQRGGDGWDFLVVLHAEGLLSTPALIDIARTAAAEAEGGWPGIRPLTVIGEGAMGRVELALDPQLGRVVARKQLQPRLRDDEHAQRLFAREARLTARLEHPGIVTIYRQEDDGSGAGPYEMPVIRGRTLAQCIDAACQALDSGERPPEDVARPALLDAFLAACDAVAYAHEQGVLHRDLKPDNLMVGDFGQVLVLDWGLAEELTGTDSAAQASGTPAYMAPEQARGERQSAAVDQYALGRILHEITTLSPPLSGTSAQVRLARAAAGHREPVRHRDGRRIERELVAIIERATHPRADRRYPSVSALARDLRRQRQDEAVLAAPDTRLQAAQRWVGHHRELTLAALLGVLALGLGSVLLVAAAGAASVEVSRRASAAREAQLAGLTDAVVRHSHHLDAALARHQGLLMGVVTAAELALDRPAPPAHVYLSEDWQDPATAPPDRVQSPLYEGAISLSTPDVVLAPGVSLESVRSRVHQLLTLAPTLQRTALRAVGDAALAWPAPQRIEAVTVEGLPIVWAYVATEEGVMAGWPGTPEPYPPDYDPRTRPWYQVARSAGEPTWSALDEDESGQGLLLTCSAPLRDRRGQHLGVAAIDLPFGAFIEQVLEAGTLPSGAEAFLVDAQGRTVMRSSQATDARTVDSYRPEAFALAHALNDASTGHTTISGQLLSWSRLEALPWTYVWLGDEERLLAP